MEKKGSEKYLQDMCDEAISELVYDKVHLIKAYNYYSGIRDRMQFAHLEENYGIGQPTSVVFIPLIRKHIDALVGEFLSMPIEPAISCKDQETLTNIFREKQNEITNQVGSIVKKYLSNKLLSIFSGEEQQEGQEQKENEDLTKQMIALEESINRNFISNYEITAQHLIKFFLQDRETDFKNKLTALLLDLFISGETYYKVIPNKANNGVKIEVLNPLNTFVDYNIKSPYLKNSYRAVCREWLSKQEIMAKYGNELSDEDFKELDDSRVDYSTNNMVLVNAINVRTGALLTDGILAGIEAAPRYNTQPHNTLKLFPVYEVEWVDFEKEHGEIITYRYSVTRIGSNIYLFHGRDKNAIRTISDPNNCTLSVNGIYHTTRTGIPYSLVLATADLQDKYDILHFYRDNVIGNSGSIGDWVDVAHLPIFLGEDLTERLQKWIAYKKTGVALFDSSQEGNMVNTAFNGYDDTIKVQTIQALDLALERVEDTASSITGVFRERLGGIEQRDAVANVKMGMQQSFIITKQYDQIMNLLTREILLDCLDTSKIVFKNGIKGMLILGDNEKRLFTALPQYFTVTDFDIHLADTTDANKEKEFLKQAATQLISSNQLDPEMFIAVSTSKSLTEMKTKIENNIAKKKKENDQINQLTQQLEEAQKQLKEMEQQLNSANSKLEQYNKTELDLQRLKIEKDYEVNKYKAESDVDYKDEMVKLQQRRVELEALQLVDNNPKNDEIKND